MDERARHSRRAYLAAVGAAVGVAGCGESESQPTPTATGTPQADTTEPSGTTTGSSPSSGDPSPVEFDGGGAAAFADALDSVRTQAASTLRLTAGTHRLDASVAPDYEFPRDDFRVHFDGRGLGDVTITGPESGTANVVLADPTRGFVLFEGGSPTVRNVAVRHDPWPHTQGQIRELSDDGRTVTLDLDAGYPTLDAPPFTDPAPDVVAASVFTAAGERVRDVTGPERGNFKTVAQTEQVDGRRYRLTLDSGVETGGLAVGRRLAVKARHNGASTFACVDCDRPTFTGVTCRSAAGFALWFVACDRPLVRDCAVARAPDSARLVSVNADGVHCDNCSAGPLVERCRFERGGDDAVVADDELLAVEAVTDDRTVAVRGTFGSRVARGDRLVATTPEFGSKPALPPVATVDEAGGGFTSGPVFPERIRFERPVRDRLAPGDFLTGPRMRNADTVVRDTTVTDIRARYVRIGGADGVRIENNEFAGTHSDGVEIGAVAAAGPGFPKGWSTDVVVRNNRLEATGLVGVPAGVPTGVVVSVDAGEESADAGPARSARPHRNVRIEGNEIVETAGPGVLVADAEGVTVRDNRLVNPGRLTVSSLGGYGLGVWNARDVAVEDVLVRADDALDGFGWLRDSVVDSAGNRYVVAGEERDATFTTVD